MNDYDHYYCTLEQFHIPMYVYGYTVIREIFVRKNFRGKNFRAEIFLWPLAATKIYYHENLLVFGYCRIFMTRTVECESETRRTLTQLHAPMGLPTCTGRVLCGTECAIGISTEVSHNLRRRQAVLSSYTKEAVLPIQHTLALLLTSTVSKCMHFCATQHM